MADRHHYAKKDPHKSLVSNYLKKIITNEETSRKLKKQVGDIRERFHDILEQSSTYEDSTCCYELVTSPIYAKYLASWESEEERKLGSPEHGKDLYQLQCIVEKQTKDIGKLQTKVMDMRECFQIMLHNLAKDEDSARILSDYLVNTCPGIQADNAAKDALHGPRIKASTEEEFQRLRNENEMLKAKLQAIHDNANLYTPNMAPVYNTFFGAKEVLIHSTKNMYIRKDSLTSTDSSSCSTSISSSANSSPVVYRTKPTDCREQHQVKLLETERWTETIAREQRPQTSWNNQVTDETHPKLIPGSVVQEEIAITTVEYRGCHMVDLRGGDTHQPQTADCHAELIQISETVQDEHDDTQCRSNTAMPRAIVSPSNDNTSAKYPTRGMPEGSSLASDSPPGTSALLGMLFTGFCDVNATECGRESADLDIDIDRVPPTFLDVLKRIRIICKSNYGKLFEELGVKPVNVPSSRCEVHTPEETGDIAVPANSHDATSTCSGDIAAQTASRNVTRTCSGDVDTPACSCVDSELRMLNTVVQTWLTEQSQHHARDTAPHMKMIKFLNNYYQRHAHLPSVPVNHHGQGSETFV